MIISISGRFELGGYGKYKPLQKRLNLSNFNRLEVIAIRTLIFSLILIVGLNMDVWASDNWGDASKEERLEQIVREWGASNGYRVSSSVAHRMASAIDQFTAVYCYSGNPKDTIDKCESIISTQSELTPVANRFLKEAGTSGKSKIESLFCLLARAIGSSAEASGWPCLEQNLIADKFRKSDEFDNSPDSLFGARPKSEWFCLNDKKVTLNGKDIQQPGRGHAQVYGDLGQAKIMISPMLSVDVVDTKARCRDGCLKVLTVHVVTALSMWRGGCYRSCGEDAMGAIRINDSYFIREKIYETLRFGMGRGSAVDDLYDKSSDISKELVTQQLNFDSRRIKYIELTDPEYAKTCRYTSRAHATPWLREMHGLMCRGDSNEAKFTLDLDAEGSLCGDDDEIIACASADNGVKLNSKSFSFVDYQNNVLFGEGETHVGIDTALLHEIGHWFGVPHTDNSVGAKGKSNIMSARFNPAGMCFRRETLTLMEYAQFLAWGDRAKGSLAFRFQSRN